jgi:hypothetical protein
MKIKNKKMQKKPTMQKKWIKVKRGC